MKPQDAIRRGPCWAASLSILAIAAVLISPCARIHHRLFYNPTDSAPRGWYWLLETTSFRIGTLVFVELPPEAAALASERRYLPKTIPLLKPIAGIPGSWICESNGVVYINGRLAARARSYDGQHRILLPWHGCRALGSNEYFLLSRHHEASFDSRYFGPITGAALLGQAMPLWTW